MSTFFIVEKKRQTFNVAKIYMHKEARGFSVCPKNIS